MVRVDGGNEQSGSLRARAIKGVAWTATSNWADQVARLVVFAILSRLLGPEAFGLVALAWVFIGLTDMIAEQGLVDALVQRTRLTPADLHTAFWMTVGLGLVLMLLLMALAVPIATALDDDALAPVLVALALVIPIGSLSHVQRAILRRDLAFRSLALRTLVGVAVGSVVGVGAALLGFGVWSLVAQRLATQLAGTAVLWGVTPWRPRLVFDAARARELFAFGKHVVGFRLLNFYNANVDNFLIGAVLGPVALGFYTVGYRILRLVIQLTSNLIDSVAFPLYARLQDDPARFRRAYYKSSGFAALVAFPAFTLLLVLAPEIVPVLFGPKWSESIPVMQILAVLGIIRSVNYLNSSSLTALGKPSWRVVIVGITAALNTAAFLVAVRYSIVAVAAAATCVGLVVTPMSYWAMRRLVPYSVRRYLGIVGGPAVGSIVLAGAVLGLQRVLPDTRPVVELAELTAVGIAAYAVTTRIVARSLADEGLDLLRLTLSRGGGRRPRGAVSEGETT
jgi:PST family polysaccharide transporter